MALEYNTDTRGVQQHYNTRGTDTKYGRSVPGSSFVKRSTWTVDLGEEITGAPTTSNALLAYSASNIEKILPAYAKVLSCRAEVITALSTTGGSAAASASIQVGLTQSVGGASPGTVVDVDGLMDATDGALTIAANDVAEPRGNYRQGGAAALVPDYGTAATPGETVSIGANPAEVTAILVINDITGMTAAAGKVRIIVEYIEEGN